MSKTAEEMTAEIVVAMIQAKQIMVSAPVTTPKLATAVAETFRTVFEAVNNPRG